MKLILAPMEGLTDPKMRQILTQVGSFDWCVSEFIRVTNVLLPDHVFLKYCPEMQNNWKTASGTPLHVQLLGNDTVALAQNAVRLVELGAPAIDLNFGCPAKTVNRHKGGAVLLDEPELLYAIVNAVRIAVPQHIPVSAKMRLGNTSDAPALQNALAIEAAGANWLTVHARTKVDGYSPPAYWDKLAPLSQHLKIPIIANGEIWNTQHAEQCQKESGCIDLMLGRGAVVYPDLSNLIRGNAKLNWAELLQLQLQFLENSPIDDALQHNTQYSDKAVVGRYKQWLGMLSQGHDVAKELWNIIKKRHDRLEIMEILKQSA